MAGSFAVCVAVALVCAHGAVGAPARHTRTVSKKARAFSEYQIPPGETDERPGGITAGPEGNLWFTETRSNKVGRTTPSGKFSLFPLPAASEPAGITVGPERNLWFTEASKIGRITPRGKVTEFPIPATELVVPPSAPIKGSSPYGITAGPGGDLWFTEWFADKIGRITPTGAISQFQIPTPGSAPYGITVGSDGNLWFTEEQGDKIGRITPTGAISEFQVPTVHSFPFGITTGREGNVWFTESFGSKIGRITPSGAISEFPTPTRHSYPSQGITAARDGNLWFTEGGAAASRIGRITPSGTISEFPTPTRESEPNSITATPNGNLWLTESFVNKIGRIEPRLLCSVPNLHGKTLTQAGKLLSRAQCRLGRVTKAASSNHKPVVVSEMPLAHAILPEGAYVSLRLG